MIRIGLVLAAGGQSQRFYAESPAKNLPKPADKSAASDGPKDPGSKLFQSLGGRTVLGCSIEKFRNFQEIIETVITVPKGRVAETKQKLGSRSSPLQFVEGGNSRAQSVLNGIAALRKPCDWVMVHDGARPMVNEDAVRRLIQAAERGRADAYVLGRKVVPTLKRADAIGSVIETVDRSSLWEAETPQLVRRKMILDAYQKNPRSFQCTDESMLIESMGGRVQMVESKSWNPKVTTQQDLDLVRSQVSKGTLGRLRTGIGKDLHRLMPGRIFWLGGIRLESRVGPVGHSDGDALLHAISDAILGGLGEGDIGEWFSDQDARWRNLPSSKILEFVMEKAVKSGWRVTHLDTIIHLERPKLGPVKLKMKEKIAQMMKLRKEQISIKAKTAEGLGDIGQNKAVSCDAVVTLERSDA